jgi:hypothetical protein
MIDIKLLLILLQALTNRGADVWQLNPITKELLNTGAHWLNIGNRRLKKRQYD